MNSQISKNFNLAEFGFAGDIPAWRYRSLWSLCRYVLQPIRNVWGGVIVTSGYRTVEHNDRIGGAANSDHLYGQNIEDQGIDPILDPEAWTAAADINFVESDNSADYRFEIFCWIYTKLRFAFGQMIWYEGTSHLHISIAGQKHQGEILFKPENGQIFHLNEPTQLLSLDRRLQKAENNGMAS